MSLEFISTITINLVRSKRVDIIEIQRLADIFPESYIMVENIEENGNEIEKVEIEDGVVTHHSQNRLSEEQACEPSSIIRST